MAGQRRGGMRTGSLAAAAALAVVAGVGSVSAQEPKPAGPGNPIIREVFTADPAALVHEGRLYVFAGRDEAPVGHDNFLMREWRVVSSADPTSDPATWEDHGALLSIADFTWADANAWAAEVVRGPDGRFYWYVSVRWAAAAPDTDRMSVGVAVADHPLGPWEDAIGGPLITSALPNASNHNIDPTVLIDAEDGIFLYWGSFWSPRYVKLKENMVELDGQIMTPEGLAEFWEAPWLFERNGVYYNAYASNANIDDDGCVTSQYYACIRYATAEHPAGPWTHRGIVLGQVSSTTNHPAIVEFPEGSDEWWMVYHTADLPGGGTFRRSVAIDRLTFRPDGTMAEVVQTRAEWPDPEPRPSDNAALTATVACSATSGWESCDALRLDDEPARSDIGGPHAGSRWGTWPEGGAQWIRYTWAEPVRIHASDIYWFQDSADGEAGGVKRPARWSMQYLGDDDWVDLPDPSEYGTALHRFNRTRFAPIVTTGLRATLEGREDAQGVGALRWKVYSVQPLEPEPVRVTTTLGSKPALPSTLTLRYEDGERLDARVRWLPYDEGLVGRTGTFPVTGVIDNSLVEATAVVTVVAGDTSNLDVEP